MKLPLVCGQTRPSPSLCLQNQPRRASQLGLVSVGRNCADHYTGRNCAMKKKKLAKDMRGGGGGREFTARSPGRSKKEDLIATNGERSSWCGCSGSNMLLYRPFK